MRANKILVKIFFPQIDKWYEILIPLDLSIQNIIEQIIKGLSELNENDCSFNNTPLLYNRANGEYYCYDSLVKETNIQNGTELIFI